MTTAIEDIFECVTIEMNMEKRKNIVVSCVYIRDPNSKIEVFKQLMEDMFLQTKQKVAYICGHFNIDINNPHKQLFIDAFIDTMLNMSLFPIITQPSQQNYIPFSNRNRQYIY